MELWAKAHVLPNSLSLSPSFRSQSQVLEYIALSAAGAVQGMMSQPLSQPEASQKSLGVAPLLRAQAAVTATDNATERACVTVTPPRLFCAAALRVNHTGVQHDPAAPHRHAVHLHH